jgi:GNAT superfamily N-acetyltransferase
MSGTLHFPPDYSETRVLEDGTEIGLRLLRPSDRELLAKGFEELSPESRYKRFFTAMNKMPERILEKMLATDDWNHLAIVAYRKADGHGLATARFIRLAGEPEVAEFAVAVIDSMQGRGLGKLLLGLVARAARERGIKRFRAHVLVGNEPMLTLLRELDPTPERTSDGRSVTYELDLPELTDETASTGPLYDLLRAAGRGLDVLLQSLRSH